MDVMSAENSAGSILSRDKECDFDDSRKSGNPNQRLKINSIK